MAGIPIENARAVLTRRDQVVATLSGLFGFMEPTGAGTSRIQIRGTLVGRPSYWVAQGVELEATWTLGPERRAGRIGAVLEILRYDVETGLVSLAGVAKLERGGPYKGPIKAE
jgi:hypothetical protein